MTTKSFDQLLTDIKEARNRKLSWLEIAQTINAIEQTPAGKLGHGSKEEFWEMLVSITGYSRNALQRMRSTHQKILSIGKAEAHRLNKIFGRDADDPEFLFKYIHFSNKAEMFARIYYFDPDSALDLLRQMKTRKVPVMELQYVLRNIANRQKDSFGAGQFVSTRDRRVERIDALALLDEQKSLLYGGENVSIYYERYKFDYVSIEAVGISYGNDGALQFVDGFIFLKGSGPVSDMPFQNTLSDIDYRSRFFRQVWLCALSPEKWPLEKMIKAINELGISQVGIITFDPDIGMKILRRPGGVEKPSRYPLIVKDIMRQGIPDFGVA